MPYPSKDILTWQEGMYYHIYNRGVNKSTLFREPKNYLFVIAKIKEYSLANHLAMVAYSLEPEPLSLPYPAGWRRTSRKPAAIRIQ